MAKSINKRQGNRVKTFQRKERKKENQRNKLFETGTVRLKAQMKCFW